MENYQLTNKAESEIEAIYYYSIENFGLDTAQQYLQGLYERFSILGDNPSWGTDYKHVRDGLCRYEYRSHSIYYKETESGVLIVRILGAKQDPIKHL